MIKITPPHANALCNKAAVLTTDDDVSSIQHTKLKMNRPLLPVGVQRKSFAKHAARKWRTDHVCISGFAVAGFLWFLFV
ncbi:MAG TPA: hypothetical protein DEF45_21530 [Rhodopirellula sp.]|nr:hypothetical protein [Rhodopirellula sp.]